MQREYKHSNRFVGYFVSRFISPVALPKLAGFTFCGVGAAFSLALASHTPAHALERFTVETESSAPGTLIPVTRIAQPTAKLDMSAAASQAKLTYIQLKSAKTAVAIADSRVMQSHGDGAWQDINPSPTSKISTLQFLDSDRGFAIDREQSPPQLWRTSDGGLHWHANALPLTGEFGSIKMHFIDANNGVVIARLPSSANFSNARLYMTSDAGVTWQALARPPIMGEIKFVSATRGWILGGADGRTLVQTVNGGKTWQLISVADNISTSTAYAMPIAVNATSTINTTSDSFIVPALSTSLHGINGARSTSQVLSQFRLDASGALTLLSRASVISGGEPARLVNADQSIVLAGNVYSLRAATSGASGAISLPVIVEPAGTLAFFAERDGARWAVMSDGICSSKQDCATMQQIATVDAFGDVSELDSPRTAASAFQQKRVVQSTNRGFDVCEVPSLSTMQTWYNSSPYKDANFYYGGRNRACKTQPLLTSSWITGTLNQGWNLLPTWVGYQSPSTSCSGCGVFSTNATTARTQGIDEANLAADAAEALGLTKPNIVYFNLEQYNTETQSEKSFIDGWSAQIRARGYVPGMYVHWSNVQSFVSLANPPQAVWVARWSGTAGNGPSTIPDPNAITSVPNNIFVNNRVWQHWGELGQTWGGINIAGIDMNVANGPVVGKDVAQQSQTISFGVLSDRVINTAAFNLSAAASSGLAVTFISATPSTCTVTGTRATLLGVGTCTFRASQAGNASYFAATNVDQSFNIGAQSQTITFSALPSRVLSSVTFDLNATTSSGLLPAYSSLTTSVCTVNGDRLSTVALGTCTVRAAQAGNAKVIAAANVDQSFQVIAISACNTSVTTGDCDLDGIPNGIEASVSKSPTTRDNDVFTVTKLFIMQTYRDLFKREATSTEINNWTTEFNAGRQNRTTMIESFLTSSDFGVKHAPVARLYLAAFNRVPQWSGQQYWAGQVGTKTIAQIADAFVSSAEFITAYGTLDDTPYINRIYQNTLARAPTSTELNNALNALAGGTSTRGGLLADLSESTANQNTTRSEVNTIMIYWIMLQRRADQSGFDYWVNQLDTAAKTTQGVISSFLGSAEYRTRFLP